MSILKKSFEISFTQVPNQIINDKKVSLKAKGLYLYMVSKPDNWEFSIKGMSSQLKESHTTILRIMDELIESFYMEKIKNRVDGKQSVNDYILHLEPFKPLKHSEYQNENQKMRITKRESQNASTSNTIPSNKEKSNTEGVKETPNPNPKKSFLREDILTFVDMKYYLVAHREDKQGNQHIFAFDDRTVSISSKGIPYFRDAEQANLDYSQSDRFYRECLSRKDLIMEHIN